MKDLQGKRVLLFSSVLFHYHDQIKSAIEDLGARVHLYDERNDPSSMQKIMIRKARFLVKRSILNYYSNVAETEKSFDPDYVLFVSPEAVTLDSLKVLKAAFPRSVFILYMWDSVKNKRNEGILGQFDRMYSFDSEDCRRYGMTFRPLFYSPDFTRSEDRPDYEYDVSFIGTVHSDRARILLQVKDFCDAQGLKYYFYLYIPGKLLYVLRMLTDRFLRKWDKKYIHINTIGKDEVARISAKTRCIIDINHPAQTGLTMRTIEMLGLGRKIATTNINIRSYDFYRPENQIVLDRKNLDISREMILKDYMRVPDEIYERYSVQYWAKEIFGLEK